MLVMILKMAAMTYPLLGRFGFFLNAPLAVIVDEKSGFRQVSGHLFGFGKNVVNSLSVSPKEIEKQIQNSEYGLSIFTYDDNRYTKNNLEMILSSCAMIGGNISEQRMAVVVFSAGIPYKYEDMFAGHIYIKSVAPLEKNGFNICPELLRNIIEKILDKMDEIKYELEHFFPVEENEFQVLQAAGSILKLILKYENMDNSERKRYGEMLDSTLDMMREKWEGISNQEEFVSDFISHLYAGKGQLFFVQERKQNSGKAIGNLERIVFYDELYYYMQNDLLEKICEPILNGLGINYAKHQLFEGGLLVGKNHSSTFGTVQISLFDERGEKIRKRYFKLLRNMIDQEEDMTF